MGRRKEVKKQTAEEKKQTIQYMKKTNKISSICWE